MQYLPQYISLLQIIRLLENSSRTRLGKWNCAVYCTQYSDTHRNDGQEVSVFIAALLTNRANRTSSSLIYTITQHEHQHVTLHEHPRHIIQTQWTKVFQYIIFSTVFVQPPSTCTAHPVLVRLILDIFLILSEAHTVITVIDDVFFNSPPLTVLCRFYVLYQNVIYDSNMVGLAYYWCSHTQQMVSHLSKRKWRNNSAVRTSTCL
jgi:hypothetical protein